MPTFVIKWNAGYGDAFEVVEADSKEQAVNMAYEAWREEAESQASYSALPIEEAIEESWVDDEISGEEE